MSPTKYLASEEKREFSGRSNSCIYPLVIRVLSGHVELEVCTLGLLMLLVQPQSAFNRGKQ